jgi:hypothetical protein
MSADAGPVHIAFCQQRSGVRPVRHDTHRCGSLVRVVRGRPLLVQRGRPFGARKRACTGERTTLCPGVEPHTTSVAHLRGAAHPHADDAHAQHALRSAWHADETAHAQRVRTHQTPHDTYDAARQDAHGCPDRGDTHGHIGTHVSALAGMPYETQHHTRGDCGQNCLCNDDA